MSEYKPFASITARQDDLYICYFLTSVCYGSGNHPDNSDHTLKKWLRLGIYWHMSVRPYFWRGTDRLDIGPDAALQTIYAMHNSVLMSGVFPFDITTDCLNGYVSISLQADNLCSLLLPCDCNYEWQMYTNNSKPHKFYSNQACLLLCWLKIKWHKIEDNFIKHSTIGVF